MYNFANHQINVKGFITLLVTLGDDEHTTTKYVQFFVVDHHMAYNAIFGHLVMRMAKMMIATFFMKIKFPTRAEICFMKSDKRIARQCHMLSVKQTHKQELQGQSSQWADVASQVLDLDSLDVRSKERVRKPKAIEVSETLQLFYDNMDKLVKISSVLTKEEKNDLVQCLKENSDIFTYQQRTCLV